MLCYALPPIKNGDLLVRNQRLATHVIMAVERHLNPGLFNPKLQPQSFHPQTFQPCIFEVKGYFNPGLFSPTLFNHELFKTAQLKSPGLKSLCLKGPGLNLGVEESGVEISFNHDGIHIYHKTAIGNHLFAYKDCDTEKRTLEVPIF